MSEEQCSTWAALAQDWPDPRKRRGRRYEWAGLLVLIGAAVASGQQSGAAIAQWVREHASEWQCWLPTAGGRVPSAATLRRTLRRLDAADVEQRVSRWVTAPAPRPPEREDRAPAAPQGLAVDGKAVRGAQRHGARVHLVSAVTHHQAQVLAQRAVADKSNEIPVVRALLAERDLHGWLVTLDAMHAQRETAALIQDQGGDYLMVVKENQPDLYAALSAWFAEPSWAEEREATVTTWAKGHGRLERRTLTRRVLTQRERLDWPGAQQALRRVTWARELSSGHERQVTTTFALTSLSGEQADVAALEAYWRGHWTVENQVHYVRDVTCGEDAGQARCGATPQVLAALRNGVLSRLRQQGWTHMAAALRHLAASVPRVLTFLGCAPHALDLRL